MEKFWPVPQWNPSKSYKQAPRKFGALRSKGRVHAGCDLYAPLHSPVIAITDGRVVEVSLFYKGTFQVTVDHGALGTVRYGELAPYDLVKSGSKVTAGEQLGKIGELGDGIPSMLHLELYSGTQSGKLTQREALPFQRRSDLVDCTALLDDLLCYRGKSC